jgi:hypothetical protein
VVLEKATHQFDFFGSAEIRTILASFLRGEVVTAGTITLPPISFRCRRLHASRRTCERVARVIDGDSVRLEREPQVSEGPHPLQDGEQLSLVERSLWENERALVESSRPHLSQAVCQPSQAALR